VATWSFLHIGETAQFQGNFGYSDDPSAHYEWDDTVPNHGKVALGDTVVIRGSREVFGIASIERLETEEGSKLRRRCPQCESTDLKRRKQLRPPYRCAGCGHPFRDPKVEEISVKRYHADYAATWTALMDFSTRELSPYYTARAAQHAIRELDGDRLLRFLAVREAMDLSGWLGYRSGMRDVTGGWRHGTGKWRRGQGTFRAELLRRDGAVCAISGNQPERVLDAVHWVPFGTSASHRLDRGMLLRKDLHALMDTFQIAFDPEVGTARLAPSLRACPSYEPFDGRSIAIPIDRLDMDVVARHYEVAVRLWES